MEVVYNGIAERPLRPPLVGPVDRGIQNELALQIDRVLGLVGQVRAAVLRFGDAAVGVRRRGPLMRSAAA